MTISNLQMFMQEEDYKDKRATDAIQVQAVDGLTLRNVSVKWAEDRTSPYPALRFIDVNAAIVRDSRADDGCGVFLAIVGAATRDVKLRHNDLGAARKSVEFETPALKKALTVER